MKRSEIRGKAPAAIVLLALFAALNIPLLRAPVEPPLPDKFSRTKMGGSLHMAFREIEGYEPDEIRSILYDEADRENPQAA